MKKEKKKEENSEYTSQLRLSLLNLLGELPNFCALLFSAITTRTVLVFVDLIDTGSNVMRNILIVLISKKLRKDLKFEYNFGVGKIEAMSAMLCDFAMTLSLIAMMGFAISDLISPRPAGDFLLFVVFVKLLNLLGDIYMFIKQKKLCKTSDSLVFRSALSVALKNLAFDATSFTALVLMNIFKDVKAFWYLSPIVSLGLGAYLLLNTVKRLNETVNIMLDKSADESVQVVVLKTLTSFYDKYDTIKNVRTRVSGGIVVIELELGFAPQLTYSEMKEISEDFYREISKKIPNCEVSLRIAGT